MSAHDLYSACRTTIIAKTIVQVESMSGFMCAQIYEIGVLRNVYEVGPDPMSNCSNSKIYFVLVVVKNFSVLTVTWHLLHPVRRLIGWSLRSARKPMTREFSKAHKRAVRRRHAVPLPNSFFKIASLYGVPRLRKPHCYLCALRPTVPSIPRTVHCLNITGLGIRFDDVVW